MCESVFVERFAESTQLLNSDGSCEGIMAPNWCDYFVLESIAFLCEVFEM